MDGASDALRGRILISCLIASTPGTPVSRVPGSLYYERRWHSLPLRRSCDQLSELLERHRAESGQYPDNLKSILKVKRIVEDRNITIRQGSFAKGGGILLETTFDDFSDDPTLYLWRY